MKPLLLQMVARRARRSESGWLRGVLEIARLPTACLNPRCLFTLPCGFHTTTEVSLQGQKSRLHAPKIHGRRKADKATLLARKGSCKQRHRLHAQQNESQITRICAETSAFQSRGLGRSMTSVEKQRRESGVGSSKLYLPDVYVCNRRSH